MDQSHYRDYDDTRFVEICVELAISTKLLLHLDSFCDIALIEWNLTNSVIKAAVNKVQLKHLLKTSWNV